MPHQSGHRSGGRIVRQRVIPSEIPASKIVARYAARFTSGTDGQTVSTIPDQAGNGADGLFQNQASKRATYRTNIINGLPVFDFDGTDWYRAAWNQTVPEPYTVYVVLNLRTPFSLDNDEVYFSGFNGANKHLFAITESTTIPTINQPLTPPDWLIEQAGADQHVVGGTPANNTWYVARIDYEPVADSVTLNGVLTVGPWNAGHLASVGITLGAREDGNRGVTGDVAELWFCKNLTAAEKTVGENTLMTLYGIS